MKGTVFLIEVCCMKHLPGFQALKINIFFAGFGLEFASSFQIGNSYLFPKNTVILQIQILQSSCMILLIRWSGSDLVLLVIAFNY